jgi:hypothetical protein
MLHFIIIFAARTSKWDAIYCDITAGCKAKTFHELSLFKTTEEYTFSGRGFNATCKYDDDLLLSLLYFSASKDKAAV